MSARKKGLTLVIAIVVVVAGFSYLRDDPVSVDIAVIQERALTITVEEQGRTRAKDPYIVASPISGRLLRSEFDEGDTVEQGQSLARIALLPEDRRTEAVSQANLISAQARYAAVEATLIEAESAYARARNEEQRRGELLKGELISSEEFELYRQLTDAAQAKLLSYEASLQAAAADVESAKSYLLGVTWDDEDTIQSVFSPINGTIYQVFEESERVIQAGARLFELSNDDALEIVVDLLTQDAVLVKPNDTILISGWGGNEIVRATVQYVEPEAFTKTSALGVEEQRVNVIAEFNNVPPSIGAGYHLEAAIIIWQEEQVLTIPSNAIFQRNDGWNTFVIENGKAKLRLVTIGQRGKEYTQVVNGIANGEEVIVFPSALVKEGVRVTY